MKSRLALKMARNAVQKWLRNMMEKYPDMFLDQKVIGAILLDCVNTVLELEEKRAELTGAIKEDETVLDAFLDKVWQELALLTDGSEEETAKGETMGDTSSETEEW